MKKYKVTVSKQANKRLREILRYLTHKIQSQQAAQAVLDDYKRTKERSSKMWVAA